MEGESRDIERIAGAVADAVRQSLSRTPPSGLQAATFSRVSSLKSSRGSGESSSSTTVTASRLSGVSKRKMPAPSAFGKRRKSEKTKPSVRAPITYIRDIMCLPKTYHRPGSANISIPRTDKRNSISEAGLIGKVEFRSDMSSLEVRQEICKVFADAMCADKLDIETGKIFPFYYLQRIGPGSRTLCIPSVSSDFEWNGKKVATLAKSGGMIYILADSLLKQVK